MPCAQPVARSCLHPSFTQVTPFTDVTLQAHGGSKTCPGLPSCWVYPGRSGFPVVGTRVQLPPIALSSDSSQLCLHCRQMLKFSQSEDGTTENTTLSNPEPHVA